MNAIDYIKNAINRISAERDKKLKAIRSGSCRDMVKAAAEFTTKRDTALELYGILSSLSGSECICKDKDGKKMLYKIDAENYASVSCDGMLTVIKDGTAAVEVQLDFCPFCGGRFRRNALLDKAKPLPSPGDRVFAIVKDGASLGVQEVVCVVGRDSELTLEKRTNALTATQYSFPLDTWREWVFYSEQEDNERLKTVLER